MKLGTVNKEQKISVVLLNKRRIVRENFSSSLMKLSGDTDISCQVFAAIEQKGRVYGIYQNKDLIGLYIFEWLEDFFVEYNSKEVETDQNSDIHNLMNDLQKVFEVGKAAYRLIFNHLLEPAISSKNKIEELIQKDIKEQMEWGQVSGIVWDDMLIYRNTLDKKTRNGSSGAGYAMGFVLGMVMGWLLFDSILLGLCFAPVYAGLFGGIIFSSSSKKQEWKTFEFVNKKYTEEKIGEQACH